MTTLTRRVCKISYLSFPQEAQKDPGHRQPVMRIPHPLHGILIGLVGDTTCSMTGSQHLGHDKPRVLRVTLDRDEPATGVHGLDGALLGAAEQRDASGQFEDSITMCLVHFLAAIGVSTQSLLRRKIKR